MKNYKIKYSENNHFVTILTHELGANYGGILQAYALQNVIKGLGYQPTTSWIAPRSTFLRRARQSISATVKSRSIVLVSSSIDRMIQVNTQRFLKEHMAVIGPLAPWKHVKGITLDTHSIVVGSDQVWRKAYVKPNFYMLSFLSDKRIRRLSYAASFGKDDLSEYTESEVRSTAALSKLFAGLSVRENSGVDIARNYWSNHSAVVHLDPTFLIASSKYAELAMEKTNDSAGDFFVYVLDRSVKNDSIIKTINYTVGGNTFELLPKKLSFRAILPWNKHSLSMPSVNQWLRSFRDAKYVVTDSFHGTVFSIIFNKKFIAIGNKNRGLARFTSLLKIFGLEDRLVTSIDDVSKDLITKDIDWLSVNKIITSEQKRSFDYLKKYLG